jgi:hypothetical protein
MQSYYVSCGQGTQHSGTPRQYALMEAACLLCGRVRGRRGCGLSNGCGPSNSGARCSNGVDVLAVVQTAACTGSFQALSLPMYRLPELHLANVQPMLTTCCGA